MDWPDNESQASVTTDWSAVEENLEWTEEEEVRPLSLLQQLLLEDLDENPTLTFDEWIDNLGYEFTLKSHVWMDELGYACTDALWNSALDEVYEIFKDLST